MKKIFSKLLSVTIAVVLLVALLVACDNSTGGTNCKHSIKESAAKAATCTESGQIQFWYCEICSATFRDANCTIPAVASDLIVEAKGHVVVVDAPVAPTYTSEGLTEGSHCSICNEIFNPQKPVDMLQDGTYPVIYNMFAGDTYLAAQTISNPNPATYTVSSGLTLQNISVPGYNFKGWYTNEVGGDKVIEIASGTTGAKELYAQWEEIEYRYRSSFR